MAPRGRLTDELLSRLAASAGHSTAGTVRAGDLAALRDIGYLTLAVPREFGGTGFTLAEVAAELRRLAWHLPALAWALHAHLYLTGAAADAHRSGSPPADWVLSEAAHGAFFAAGHDLVLAHPDIHAQPEPDGGYRLYGEIALAPAPAGRTWLGLRALDASHPGNPQVVYAFVRPDNPGCHLTPSPGACAGGAAGSAVALDGARTEFPAASVVPVGPPADPFAFAMLCWALPLSSTIHYAAAERAFELVIESARQRMRLPPGADLFARRPHAGWTVADVLLELDAISGRLHSMTHDRPAHVARRQWILKLFTARRCIAEGATRVMGFATQSTGDNRHTDGETPGTGPARSGPT